MTTPTWQTPFNLGSVQEGTIFSTNLVATPSILSDTITYSLVSGSQLPLNLSLSSSGLLSGTISNSYHSTVTLSFTVRATESNSTYSDRTFYLQVITPTPIWTTPSGFIGTFISGQPLSFQFAATPAISGDTITYSLLSGVLPTGTLNNALSISNTGLLTGIPVQALTNEYYEITVRVEEYNGSTLVGLTDRSFILEIAGSSIPFFITPSGSLGNLIDSIYYSYQIQYEDPDQSNITSISLSLGLLPLGLEVDSTGLISGYPTPPVDINGNPTTITYNFTLALQGTTGETFANYSITVSNQNLNDVNVTIATINNSSPAVLTLQSSNSAITGQSITLTSTPPMPFLTGATVYLNQLTPTTYQLYKDPNLSVPIDTTTQLGWGINTGSAVVHIIRTPVILNNQPLTQSIPASDPNSPFYINGNQIATVVQLTDFSFKFIGYDFDGREIQYYINSIPEIGLTPHASTGWIDGTISEIGETITYFSFAVVSQWVINPNVVSNQYRFIIKIIGNINANTSWITPSNLGTINNTDISMLSVQAVSENGYTLNYRVVGFPTSANLTSVALAPVLDGITTTLTLVSVGTNGEYVTAPDTTGIAETWTEQPQLTNGSLNQILNISFGGQYQTIAIGNDKYNNPLLLVSSNLVTWSAIGINAGIPSNTAFNGLYYNGDYIIVGDNGTILLGSLGIITSSTTWTLQNSNTTIGLNSVVEDGGGHYVVTGNNGTVLYSADGVTWNTIFGTIQGIDNITNPSGVNIITTTAPHNLITGSQVSISDVIGIPNINNVTYYVNVLSTTTFALYYDAAFTNPVNYAVTEYNTGTGLVVTLITPSNLNSVVYRQSNPSPSTNGFIAVGNNSIIITSVNGIVWTVRVNYTLNDFYFVYHLGPSSNVTIIGGSDGTILRSTDGINWTPIIQQITQNSLRSATYDNSTGILYIVGDGGTVLASSDQGLTWSSPTLGVLPSNLYLDTFGNITGRVNYQQPNGQPWSASGTEFTFRVQAYFAQYSVVTTTQDFTLTVNELFTTPYQNLYIQAYPSMADRQKITDLLQNSNIINNNYLYRPDDPYFGKATYIIYNHLYGVDEASKASYYEYVNPPFGENHYQRQITLGQIKTAVARDANDNILYEVVYSEIIDDLVNNNGVSIPKQITWPRQIPQIAGPWFTSTTQLLDSYTFYDPNPTVLQVASVSGNVITFQNDLTQFSIEIGDELTGMNVSNSASTIPPAVTSFTSNTITFDTPQPNLEPSQLVFLNNPAYTALTNDPYSVSTLYPNSLLDMRLQIEDSLGSINNSSVLPLWMNTDQGDGSPIGYVAAWVICYTKPGYSSTVVNDINTNWPYTLNQINFRVDRFEVDNMVSNNPPTPDNTDNWYIIFQQRNILPNSSISN